jgi:hypothetical protein
LSNLDAIGVIRFLNRLRQRKLIPRYVVVGGVAAIRYGVPRLTKDFDVVVLVDDLFGEYARIWTAIAREAGGVSREQLIYVKEADTWLDVMATGGKPFWQDALENADEIRVEGVKTRWVTREHLIFMALESFRPDPDYSRIGALYPQADKLKLRKLLEKYDDAEGIYARRLQKIVGE